MATTTTTTTTPEPPVLMLEGDPFDISNDGISRSFYQLKTWTDRASSLFGVDAFISDENDAPVENHHHLHYPMCIEEAYNLQRAQKTFVIRRQLNNNNNNNSKKQGVVNMGRKTWNEIQVQEIDRGVFGSAGTGATTWESSIVMSMYFSAFPHLLRGHVLELGSGVGLGGILLGRMAHQCPYKSLTLTDGNDEVLEECQHNMAQHFSYNHSKQEYCQQPLVEKLDWYDTLVQPPAVKYDTIIASDCAYVYKDIYALANTMKACLRDRTSQIHIFGPHNRGGLHQLITELRERHKMHLVVDEIEMTRYRLKSASTTYSFSSSYSAGAYPSSPRSVTRSSYEQDAAPVASQNVARYLHITASRDEAAVNFAPTNYVSEDSISDID